MTKKRKVIISIISIIVVILAAAVIVGINGINCYIDTHTWATIRVTGEIHAYTDDAIYEEHEYLKGDQITFADVTLTITKITTAGDVSFSVKHGNLYGTDKHAVQEDTLHKAVNTAYTIDHGSINLQVTDNRYQ